MAIRLESEENGHGGTGVGRNWKGTDLWVDVLGGNTFNMNRQ